MAKHRPRPMDYLHRLSHKPARVGAMTRCGLRGVLVGNPSYGRPPEGVAVVWDGLRGELVVVSGDHRGLAACGTCRRVQDARMAELARAR